MVHRLRIDEFVFQEKMTKEEIWFKIRQLTHHTNSKGENHMARRASSGDDAEDKITTEDGGSKPQDQTAAVLVEDPIPQPHSKRRRVQRREEQAFTSEERLAIEQEIIQANGNLRDIEDTKKNARQNLEWSNQ